MPEDESITVDDNHGFFPSEAERRSVLITSVITFWFWYIIAWSFGLISEGTFRVGPGRDNNPFTLESLNQFEQESTIVRRVVRDLCDAGLVPVHGV